MVSMPPTPDAVPAPAASRCFTLLALVGTAPDPDWVLELARLAGALPEAECLVLGHGRPEEAAPPLRALAAWPTPPRVEIRTRPLSPAAALVAATTVARAPWVLWLPAAAGLPSADVLRQLWSRAGEADFLQAEGGACLFRRDVLLRLPRIPAMHRCLPELFARHAAQPPASGAGRWRRAYVAVACTMAPGGAPARRPA